MWDLRRRIKRAEELLKFYPFAREVLSFYCKLASFQSSLYSVLASQKGAELSSNIESDSPWEDLRAGAIISQFEIFLNLIASCGPHDIASLAQELGEGDRSDWERLLTHYWRWRDVPDWGDEAKRSRLGFLAKAFLQPYAELIAEGLRDEGKLDALGLPPFCPLCGGRPQVGYLSSEGEGAKRMLICSLCATEWRYQRVRCCWCGESQAEMLTYYSAEEFDHIRLEACQSCRFYLKIVDLTRNGSAVPLVDDLASIPMDLWAMEQRYAKKELNLAGV